MPATQPFCRLEGEVGFDLCYLMVNFRDEAGEVLTLGDAMREYLVIPAVGKTKFRKKLFRVIHFQVRTIDSIHLMKGVDKKICAAFKVPT